MSVTRRTLLTTSLAGAAALATRKAGAQPAAAAKAAPAGGKTPSRVVMPNGSPPPWEGARGVKAFHLRAMPIKHQIAPGLDIEAWGYSGSSPGPLIEVTEGDHVRIYVTNALPEPTSVHWHGVFVPNGMDGVAGLTQKPIAPGKTFKYEFVFDRPGTFMYHPHGDEMTQI